MEQVQQSEKVKLLMLDENPVLAVDKYVGIAKKLSTKENDKLNRSRRMIPHPSRLTYGTHYLWSMYESTFDKYPRISNIIGEVISATSN